MDRPLSSRKRSHSPPQEYSEVTSNVASVVLGLVLDRVLDALERPVYRTIDREVYDEVYDRVDDFAILNRVGAEVVGLLRSGRLRSDIVIGQKDQGRRE